MASYKLKDDFVNGVLPNTNGKPNILFKKGDIINGIITEKFLFNRMTKGIISKPTVAEAIPNSDGLVFVPLESVSNVEDIIVKSIGESDKEQNLLVGGNTLTAEDKFYESLGIKKSSGGWGIQSRPMGRLLVAVVLVGGYFAYKKFKK